MPLGISDDSMEVALRSREVINIEAEIGGDLTQLDDEWEGEDNAMGFGGGRGVEQAIGCSSL